MTQYAIATDLNRCVGCLACSAACKSANEVPIGNFWNKTLRIGPNPTKGGSGQFPDVELYFLTVQCQHCLLYTSFSCGRTRRRGSLTRAALGRYGPLRALVRSLCAEEACAPIGRGTSRRTRRTRACPLRGIVVLSKVEDRDRSWSAG